MKIVITKINKERFESKTTPLVFNTHWEVEYNVQDNDVNVYLTGQRSFINILPSEEDMLKTIKQDLIRTIKELL